MTKYVELRRHTDNEDGDGDRSTARRRLRAARLQWGTAVHADAGMLPGGTRPEGVGRGVVEDRLRSELEDRWKAAYKKAGSGELDAMRSADPELVEKDSSTLASGLRRVLDRLSEGGRALVVGQSPTNEAAVLGLAGELVESMSKATACPSWRTTVVTGSSRSVSTSHEGWEPKRSPCTPERGDKPDP